MDLTKIRVIGFDADDTLWINEPYYRETEKKFCELFCDFASENLINNKLLEIEIQNIELYGFGTKAFMLSLIETALEITGNKITQKQIGEIIRLGKEQIQRKNEIFPDTETVLKELSGKYRLIVATKGDLLDQERKLKNSGLLKYFHHIEIMSNKNTENYNQLLQHLDIQPVEFLMIGNSIKSDILPVLELGANAIHIPFHTTWVYEDVVEDKIPDSNYIMVGSIREVLKILNI
ncbi:MAG: HAD family hydrolase [Prolixibacteraceae bacterium]|nr:HAD family hydrolase [Prolixibacteraceae bacterium]